MRFLFLLLLTACAIAAHAEPIAADRIVAVVNSDAITLNELKARVAQVERQLAGQNAQPPARDVLVQQVLERMIVDRAQAQLAKDSGIRVGDDELDAALRRIAEANRMTLADFKTAVTKDGVLWARFREEIREEILVSRVKEREVDSRITVSDGEVDNYLANVASVGDANVQVNLAHVMVRIPENASPEQLAKLQAKASQALSLLRGGENFAKVAASFSDAPDALSGGQLGMRPVDRLPSLYADAIRSLKTGELSNLLRSPVGFHIIKVIEKRGGVEDLPTLRQTHARHILIRVNEVVSESEARQKLASLKERLDHGGDFAELARLHSNDLSASKGGDLGWLYQGDTVPDFEKAMDSLKPGEVSQPIQTPFGWHLIQVLERRNDEATPERKRLAARQALRERKAAEAYDDWLRQLRDRTYVEYKLEDK
ncbi:MAG TPA: peptidylprolyl isomerase [Rhodocyclaceae bacterium]